MNLFDVTRGFRGNKNDKPRTANDDEIFAYAHWLRVSRGLPNFPGATLRWRSQARGADAVCVAVTFGGDKETGAYSLLLPGYASHRDKVTFETLGEDGEPETSQTLPVEPKKGGVIWDKAAVRKACGPVEKPAKGKRAKVAPPIPVAAPAVEPVEAQEAPALTCDKPEAEIMPVAAPAVDLEAITARLDALEQALATLSAGQGATVEAEPVAERPKRTAAHERVIRRAWAERRAFRTQRDLAGQVKAELKAASGRQEELATALQLAKDEQALDKQALSEAYARAEQFARRGNQHRERRLATARRARRMMTDIRDDRARARRNAEKWEKLARGQFAKRAAMEKREAVAVQRANAARAEIDRLKRDMADPSQPERASDIARLVQERDTARTALAAMAARAERAEQGLHSMADRFEGLVSRVTRAEAALRQSQAVA